MSVDVVVVGGGLAGLATAALAARAGRRVVVLEGAPKVGGRAATEGVDGFRFDRGAHALFLGGAAERVTRSLLGGLPPGRAAFTAGSVLLHRGDRHALPDGLVGLAGASWLGSGGRLALAGWFARVGLGAGTPAGTVRDWLSALPTEVGEVAAAFARVTTYAGDLDRLDAAFAADVLRTAFRHGVYYVEGGWQALADGLRAAAERSGAEIRTGVAARRAAPGRVETDDGAFAARDVVLAVPPERARELVPSLPETSAPARVAAWQLALRADVVDGPVQRLVLSTERPVFLSNFTPVVPMGPAGAHVVHAIRYLPTGGAPAAEPKADLEDALDRAWPRWRGGVVAERWLPSMVTSPALPEPGRPRLPVDAVPGLWLAGDGYGAAGHLADAAFASAEAVVARLTGAREAAA